MNQTNIEKQLFISGSIHPGTYPKKPSVTQIQYLVSRASNIEIFIVFKVFKPTSIEFIFL